MDRNTCMAEWPPEITTTESRRDSWKEGDPVTPYVRRPAWWRMSPGWELLHDLIGGTLAMRAAGKRWLPQYEKESPEAWQARRDCNVLFDGYEAAVSDLSDMPFMRPLEATNVPQELKYLVENATGGTARTLSDVCNEGFYWSLVHGGGYFEVDFTRMPDGATKADEERLSPRAFVRFVSAPRLLFWLTDAAGALVRVHIYETLPQADGSDAPAVRVWTPSGWELWREKPGQERLEADKREWYKADSGANALGAVPLVPVSVRSVGAYEYDPPLASLAFANLAHWQSSSDQRQGLRFARVGVLFASGFRDEELEKLVVSSNRFIGSTNENAKLGYVEHSGAAMKIGFDDLDRLERQMAAMAVQPLTDRATDVKATSAGIEDRNSTCSLSAWAARFEPSVRAVVEMAGRWRNRSFRLPDDCSLRIYKDFVLPSQNGVLVSALAGARAVGDISRVAYLRELRRYGALGDAFDAAKDLEELKREMDDLPVPRDPKAPKASPVGGPNAGAA